ncbi:HBL/NHE enterotoxin family protein [Pseudoalteromonas obscura]|uniref:HBL/NHE enterotoxin family protein n=1 Tax=Pseudoalteromonas obscura TaxID=3048491 RepID=A0ABT7EPD1_9GAMM|nr:HBL/NHE enterotoxin family protein [Pseudoalteromonas sp. P94(2023)]MDK2596905.1 HBL/NHE enterotoxin family protein [Pseudoalteromonas sp. P94(2023)]
MPDYSQLSLMPDNKASQQAINNTMSAASQVSLYASRALAIELNPSFIPSALYQELSQVLNQVQSHAKTWLNDLGPKVVQTFPNQIIEITPAFNQAADTMIATMEQIRQQQGEPTQQQRDALSNQLNGLLGVVEQQVSELDSIQQQLVAFNESLEQDQKSLNNSNADIQRYLNDSQTNEKSLKAQIDSINSQISSKQKSLSYMWLGGPVAIALIEKEISDLKSKQKKLMAQYSDVHQQCIQITQLQDVFSGLQMENVNVQEVFSLVLDQGEVVKEKFTAVTDALNQAANEDVLIILEQLDLEVAKSAWNELDEFVKNLSSQAH